MITTARPPITPPTIAPTGALLPPFGGIDGVVLVGPALELCLGVEVVGKGKEPDREEVEEIGDVEFLRVDVSTGPAAV